MGYRKAVGRGKFCDEKTCLHKQPETRQINNYNLCLKESEKRLTPV